MDKTQLSKWVNDFTDDLYQRARHKTGDPHLASDLVQDTFMAAAESLEDFRNESSPKTWLFAIHCVANGIKHRSPSGSGMG
ncbi:RNA polymerase sigma factor [Anaerophaga thermohalophila]|uniref:RNA polymerase sigma factor n=1 Tax=Anaerophaga thermohalophila TaxID=177400 RepID=UPI000237C6AD|nr:RNA polymerase sigma factor [Anaerophaga thermohalophila]